MLEVFSCQSTYIKVGSSSTVDRSCQNAMCTLRSDRSRREASMVSRHIDMFIGCGLNFQNSIAIFEPLTSRDQWHFVFMISFFPTPLQSTQILYNGLSLISVCLFELTVKVNITDRNVYFIGRNSKYEKLTCPICCFANNQNIDARPFNSRYGGLSVCIANLALC